MFCHRLKPSRVSARGLCPAPTHEAKGSMSHWSRAGLHRGDERLRGAGFAAEHSPCAPQSASHLSWCWRGHPIPIPSPSHPILILFHPHPIPLSRRAQDPTSVLGMGGEPARILSSTLGGNPAPKWDLGASLCSLGLGHRGWGQPHAVARGQRVPRGRVGVLPSLQHSRE